MPTMSVGVERKCISRFIISGGLGGCGGTASEILYFNHSGNMRPTGCIWKD